MENGWNNRFYLGTVPDYDASKDPHRSSFVETSFFRKRLMNALEDKNNVKVLVNMDLSHDGQSQRRYLHLQQRSSTINEDYYSSHHDEFTDNEEGVDSYNYTQDSSKRRRSTGAHMKRRLKGSDSQNSFLFHPSTHMQSRRPATQKQRKLSQVQSPYLLPLVPLAINDPKRPNKVCSTFDL